VFGIFLGFTRFIVYFYVSLHRQHFDLCCCIHCPKYFISYARKAFLSAQIGFLHSLDLCLLHRPGEWFGYGASRW